MKGKKIYLSLIFSLSICFVNAKLFIVHDELLDTVYFKNNSSLMVKEQKKELNEFVTKIKKLLIEVSNPSASINFEVYLYSNKIKKNNYLVGKRFREIKKTITKIFKHLKFKIELIEVQKSDLKEAYCIVRPILSFV